MELILRRNAKGKDTDIQLCNDNEETTAEKINKGTNSEPEKEKVNNNVIMCIHIYVYTAKNETGANTEAKQLQLPAIVATK